MQALRGKWVKRGIVTLVLFGLLAPVGFFIKDMYRSELLSSPIVHRLIPLYRSLRKFPDIVFLPWSAFAKTHLPIYELSISPQNIERMNSVLPESPFMSGMDEDSKLWVSGYFRTNDYEGNVKVRYRGNLSTHWNAYQKSYAIKFPKDNLFHGMRSINIVIPYKRNYIGMMLHDYRAEKLGLIHPSESLVRFEVNGADTGVLYTFEDWSQEWIEKMPMSALSTIYGIDEGSTPSRERWKSWNAIEPVDFDPLETLEEIIDHASDEEFKKLIPLIIDIEDWYAWDVIRILASGYHVTGNSSFGENNLVIIFDRAEGRFKPVPYNTFIYTPSYKEFTNNSDIVGEPTRLYQRILSIPEFRERRDKVFREYVENEKADDLAYIKEWKDTYNREFLMDNGKNGNNFMYLSAMKEYIDSSILYYDDPYNMIGRVYKPLYEVKEELDMPDSFKYLHSAALDPKNAASQHSSLFYTDEGIVIYPGKHFFTKTVIIPRGTKLMIMPGSNLYFDKGVSFISYSPVSAEGTEESPIQLRGREDDTTWGVFAVLNTETDKSFFSYVQADQGSEDTINGAYISGTIALHNADGTITNSSVTDAEGDDGLNIKGGTVVITENVFKGNSSDGVDLDYIGDNSIFTDNIFIDNGGDAIDISWTNISIKDNEIHNCFDKGVSVGESSRPIILSNSIDGCMIGIAVKDSSEALIEGNVIMNTETPISLYQKKPYFLGGNATATKNFLYNNKAPIFTDSLSSIILVNNSMSTSSASEEK